MKRVSLVFALAAAAGVAAVAAADIPSDNLLRGNQAQNIAAIGVGGVISNGQYRAIAGRSTSDLPYVIVERIEAKQIQWQYWIRNATWNGRYISIDAARELWIDQINPQYLKFRVDTGRTTLSCNLDMTQQNWQATCTGGNGGGWNGGNGGGWNNGGNGGGWNGGGHGHGHGGQGRVPSMAEITAVTEACNQIFYYNPTERAQCATALEPMLRGKMFASATAVPPACSDAFYYNTSERLQCVRHLATAIRAPKEVTDYCKQQFYYDTPGRLQCVADWSRK